MANMIGNGVQMAEFKQVVEKTISGFYREAYDKDNMYLVALLGTFLVLKKEGMLSDMIEGKIDFVKQWDEINDRITVMKENRNCNNDKFTFDLLSVLQAVIENYWSYACNDHGINRVSGGCKTFSERMQKEGMISGNLNCIQTFVNYISQVNDDDNLLCVYDYVLSLITCPDPSVDHSCLIQPKEVVNLMSYLMDVKEGDTVCNKSAGAAYYSECLSDNATYIGFEENPVLWRLGMIKLALTDIREKHFYNFADYNKDICCEIPENAKWLSMPPMSYNKYAESYHFGVDDGMSYHSDYEEQIYTGSLETEECIIVPANILYNRTKKWVSFRQWFSNSGDLHTVILLPSNIIGGSNVQMAIIRPTNNEEFEAGTDYRLVNASDCSYVDEDDIPHLDFARVKDILQSNDSKYVCFPFKEIDSHDFSWDPREYLNNETVNTDITNGESKTIWELISGGYVHGTDQNKGKGHVVRITDLSKSPFDVLNPSSLKLEEIPDGTYGIDIPVIAVSLVHSFMPTIIMANEDCPVFIDKNIFTFTVKEELADPMYIAYKLSQVKSEYYYRGLVVPRVDSEDILRIKVNLCPLELQKNTVAELAQENSKAKVREAGLYELMAKMKAEYINEVRMRKHDMKPYIEDLLNSHELVKHYVDESVIDGEAQKEINALLDGMYRSITCLSDSLNNLSREDKFGEPENVDIDSFIRDLVSRHPSTDSYTLRYNISALALPKDVDGSYASPMVQINTDDLRSVCDNIISNALHHGFVDKSRKDYAILINLSADYDTGMYIIDFCDNGKGFPKWLTKERYGMKGEKAGATGKTGIGGYRVKSIVQHFNGDYDIIRVSNSLYPNVIRVYLPIMFI